MRKTSTRFTAAIFATLLVTLTINAALAVDPGPEQPVSAAPAADTVEVGIELGPKGFVPTSITLEKDVPARLVFTRTTDATCAKVVQFPAFDIENFSLPLNVPAAVVVHPQDNGQYAFACSMDMIKGTVLVEAR